MRDPYEEMTPEEREAFRKYLEDKRDWAALTAIHHREKARKSARAAKRWAWYALVANVASGLINSALGNVFLTFMCFGIAFFFLHQLKRKYRFE